MNKRQFFVTSAGVVALVVGGAGLLSASSAGATPDGLEPNPRGTISGTYGNPALLTCTGSGASGDIDGDGKPDEIAVDALHYNVKSPRDSASGMASGKRQHRPVIVIRKEFGPSSSAWSRLYSNGTSLSCTMTHKGIGTYSDGTPRDVTMQLTGVTVTDHQVMLGDTRSPDEGPLGMHEEIELTTAMVTWSSTRPT